MTEPVRWRIPAPGEIELEPAGEATYWTGSDGVTGSSELRALEVQYNQWVSKMREDARVDEALAREWYPHAPGVSFRAGRGWGPQIGDWDGSAFEAVESVDEDGHLTTLSIRIPFFMSGVRICQGWAALMEDKYETTGEVKGAGVTWMTQGLLDLKYGPPDRSAYPNDALRERAAALHEALHGTISFARAADDVIAAQVPGVASRSAQDPYAPPGLQDLLGDLSRTLGELGQLGGALGYPVLFPLRPELLPPDFTSRLQDIQTTVDRAVERATDLELDYAP